MQDGDPRYASVGTIKTAFVEYLREQPDPIPVGQIMDFLIEEGYADDSNVVSKRRALMRKITGDPTFLFFGDTSGRHVMFNHDNERTQAQKSAANSLLSILIKRTILDGMDMSMNADELADYGSLDGLNLLVTDGVVEMGNNNLRWTERGFIGYEPQTKRTSSLNLPERTWSSVDEVIQLLYLANEMMGRGDMPEDLVQHPMVHSLLTKGPTFNKSEVAEAAIEHLRCTLQRLVHPRER